MAKWPSQFSQIYQQWHYKRETVTDGENIQRFSPSEIKNNSNGKIADDKTSNQTSLRRVDNTFDQTSLGRVNETSNQTFLRRVDNTFDQTSLRRVDKASNLTSLRRVNETFNQTSLRRVDETINQASLRRVNETSNQTFLRRVDNTFNQTSLGRVDKASNQTFLRRVDKASNLTLLRRVDETFDQTSLRRVNETLDQPSLGRFDKTLNQTLLEGVNENVSQTSLRRVDNTFNQTSLGRVDKASNLTLLRRVDKTFNQTSLRRVDETSDQTSLRRVNKTVEFSPWHGVPEFVLYLRLTAGKRWEHEFKNVLIRTMRIFFPKERAKLVVALDDEKQEDHDLGERMKTEWPFPDICYMKPGDKGVYHGWGKGRMFWDMMYPDKCTNATYVGYVDSDTFFSTLVTPQLLFEDGKPIIVAKIGLAPYPCWEDTTENFLGEKEVMQCMSTFPVMMKTKHMIEMREFLSRQQGKSFDEIFRDSAQDNDPTCICQFSLMCNYVWYYHRDEYSWHLQMVPDGNWKGENLLSSQVPVEYYEREVRPEMRIPIPRSSIHLRYTITNGRVLDKQEPKRHVIEDFIKEGLCYSGGFEYCPEKCRRWDNSKIHYNLYSFETYQWFWDKRCKEEQDKHYRNVKKIVNYYIRHNMEIFGLSSIKEMCTLI